MMLNKQLQKAIAIIITMATILASTPIASADSDSDFESDYDEENGTRYYYGDDWELVDAELNKQLNKESKEIDKLREEQEKQLVKEQKEREKEWKQTWGWSYDQSGFDNKKIAEANMTKITVPVWTLNKKGNKVKGKKP